MVSCWTVEATERVSIVIFESKARTYLSTRIDAMNPRETEQEGRDGRV